MNCVSRTKYPIVQINRQLIVKFNIFLVKCRKKNH